MIADSEHADRQPVESGPQRYIQRQDLAMAQLFNLSRDLLVIAGFDGYFKQVNPSWTRTLGWSSAEMLAQPYIDFVHPADRGITADEVVDLEGGETTLNFENRYRCSDGSYRWISWTATPSEAEGLIYAAARDITPLRRAAQVSDAKAAAGSAAAVATNWHKAIPAILRAICESLGMDVGEVWRVNRATTELEWETAWSRPGRSLSKFVRLGRETRIRPGEGLVGTTFQADRPVEIANVAIAVPTKLPRLLEAQRQGLHGGIGIPLHSGGKLAGVMVFFGPDILPIDEGLTSALADLGSLVGGLIERLSVDEHVRRMAFFDPLTGLPNRSLFIDRYLQAVKTAKRSRQRVRVLVLDLDGFKGVNDRHGHAAGDEVLRQAARRMTACLRTSDTVARLGGDEFGVVAVTSDGPEANRKLANKLTEAIRAPFQLAGVNRTLGVSIGATTATSRRTDISRLLSEADQAMYVAKRRGMSFAEHGQLPHSEDPRVGATPVARLARP